MDGWGLIKCHGTLRSPANENKYVVVLALRTFHSGKHFTILMLEQDGVLQ